MWLCTKAEAPQRASLPLEQHQSSAVLGAEESSVSPWRDSPCLHTGPAHQPCLAPQETFGKCWLLHALIQALRSMGCSQNGAVPPELGSGQGLPLTAQQQLERCRTSIWHSGQKLIKTKTNRKEKLACSTADQSGQVECVPGACVKPNSPRWAHFYLSTSSGLI